MALTEAVIDFGEDEGIEDNVLQQGERRSLLGLNLALLSIIGC